MRNFPEGHANEKTKPEAKSVSTPGRAPILHNNINRHNKINGSFAPEENVALSNMECNRLLDPSQQY
jgi:hypothetical protein